jgi:hypothetical protein
MHGNVEKNSRKSIWHGQEAHGKLQYYDLAAETAVSPQPVSNESDLGTLVKEETNRKQLENPIIQHRIYIQSNQHRLLVLVKETTLP